ERFQQYRGVGMNPDLSTRAERELAHGSFHVIEAREEVANVPGQFLASIGRRYAPRLPLEQLDRVVPFEIADSLGHRRRRDVVTPGRPGQVFQIEDGEEQPQRLNVGISHRRYFYCLSVRVARTLDSLIRTFRFVGE